MAITETLNREDLVERIKTEILADIAAGIVPVDVPDFSALHDHVDANCYGGLCELAPPAIHTEAISNIINAAQADVDGWLKAGRGALWIKEHGRDYAVPTEILKRVDLEDMSWHNDTSPSFGREIAETTLRIWVEHPDVAMREREDAKRFTVLIDGEDETCRYFQDTDDVGVALAAFDEFASRISGGK